MQFSDRIVQDAQILGGKPVIKGTRLAVEFLLELLAGGEQPSEILANYPGLNQEDILACLSYASYLVHEYKFYPVPAQMWLLADENIPKPAVELLRGSGHDVLWARTHFAGWADFELLSYAESDSRVLLTLDKDYWQLASRRKNPLRNAGVVWFRVHPATWLHLKPLFLLFLSSPAEWAGQISIVTRDGMQVLPLRIV